jgi:hypothetical protein
MVWLVLAEQAGMRTDSGGRADVPPGKNDQVKERFP